MPNEKRRQYERVAGRVHFQKQVESERMELWKLEKELPGFSSGSLIRQRHYHIHPAPTGINPVFVATEQKAREVASRYPDYNLVRA